MYNVHLFGYLISYRYCERNYNKDKPGNQDVSIPFLSSHT